MEENFQSCEVVRSRFFQYSLRLKRTVIIIVLVYTHEVICIRKPFKMDLMVQGIYGFVWLSDYSLLRVVNTALLLQDSQLR